MRPRDAAILAAVLLIAGFAAADELRKRAARPEKPAAPATTRAATTTTVPLVPRGRFARVPAPGILVFTEEGSCAVREVNVSSGRPFRVSVERSACQLWAAPVTSRIAVGVGAPSRDAIPFRFVDLARPRRELGGYHALFGVVLWSHDGQRAAWCGISRTGFDLELGRAARRLPRCPAAYTPEGQIAYAVGNRLFVEGRTVLRTGGAITFAQWGSDGSLAVLLDGERLRRYERGRPVHGADLSGPLRGEMPILSPDNCAALLPIGEKLRLVELGCFPVRRQSFPGGTAAWSPDRRWIAVADRGEIVFYDLLGDEDPIHWPIGAVEIGWRLR